MKKIFFMVSVLVGSVASAQYYQDYKEDAFFDYVTADVVEVEPIVEIVSVPERREFCERIPAHQRYKKMNHAGAVVGGIIGGVLGNQVGKGNGRKAATAAGVIIGSSIGHVNDKKRAVRHDVDTRCYVDTVYRDEEQVIGYDVAYRYLGQLRHVQMNQHPGDKLRLRVDVMVME